MDKYIIKMYQQLSLDMWDYVRGEHKNSGMFNDKDILLKYFNISDVIIIYPLIYMNGILLRI